MYFNQELFYYILKEQGLVRSKEQYYNIVPAGDVEHVLIMLFLEISNARNRAAQQKVDEMDLAIKIAHNKIDNAAFYERHNIFLNGYRNNPCQEELPLQDFQPCILDS